MIIFPDHKGKISADSIQAADGYLLLSIAQVTVEFSDQPRRYLYSGWQSWSLTAWLEIDRPLKPLRPSIMHPRETDPAYTVEKRPNGSWYGAVELTGGKTIFLGALDLESHVLFDNHALKGWYENGVGDWFIMIGDEDDFFGKYVQLLEDRFGKYRFKEPFRVWCSWYSLYDEIDEGTLFKILVDLGDLPFDVFQVDDGWEKSAGDWEPNAKFPEGMEKMAAHIHATGRKAGLWLAPLLVSPSSAIFHHHRDWLLHDEKGHLVRAGYNWGDLVYALDITHPCALAWLTTLMEKIRAWGYDYFKLDFLYAGALPGKRYRNIPREAAYREGLRTMRVALGDAYLLVCGSPILPSLGLCDGMRIGQDVAEYWDSRLFNDILVNFGAPGVHNALRNSVNRLWLKPLVHTDPDVVFFSSQVSQLAPGQRLLMQDLATIAGFKATSDIPAWLTATELAALRDFLFQNPVIKKLGQASYEIDGRLVNFGSHLDMPSPPGAISNTIGAILGGLANFIPIIRIFDAINRKSLRKRLKGKPIWKKR
jgi:alpha-galactosidase